MSRKNPIQWILVTGLSGAGKTSALKILEDLGFFTIDNLPTSLVPALIREYLKAKSPLSKVVLGMDVRERNFATSYSKVLHALKDKGVRPQVLFLESSPEVLLRRFSESRRPHPLATGRTLRKAIQEEIRRLAPLRRHARWVVDTSEMNVHTLKKVMRQRFSPRKKWPEMQVTLLSFGYKFGLPAEADLVLDVRFLENPFFIPRLKNLDGSAPSVKKFIWDKKDTQAFVRLLSRFLNFLLPRYQGEGKSALTIAFGCTGGRHRSVAIVEGLAGKLKKGDWEFSTYHRDNKRAD